jgi:diguanylate cyclase (GGDEF)-like protein/PAS domain S-box-containing protein
VRLFRSQNLIGWGVVICVAVWLLDASIDCFILSKGTGHFIAEFFNPAPIEILSRSFTAIIILLFSAYAQKIVNQRREMEESLDSSQCFSRKVLDSMNDAVAIINVSDYRIVQVNSIFLRETNRTESEVVGLTCYEVSHGRTDACSQDDHPCPLLESAITGASCQSVHVHRSGDTIRDVEITTSPITGSDGNVIQVVHVSRDVTERKKSEREIEKLAYFDPLTSLPNRLLFLDRLRQAIIQAARDGLMTGVLFLDLDRFKGVNDTLGHSIGDKLLMEAAGRLRGCIRKADTVARMGGDEFVIVLTSIVHEDDINAIAGKILQVMAEPFLLDGNEVYCTASIGIAISPRDGKEIGILLRNADTAMYQAKDKGRNTYQFFSQEMNVRVMERLTLETRLRHALERDELFLNYQPQICLETGTVTGVEALLRWRTFQNELIPPSRFILLAEETGLIIPIGEWVLRTACRQYKRWQAAGLPSFRVAVNISARQIRQPDFVECVANILMETRFDPHYLDIELTESTIMENPNESREVLMRLKDLGVGLSIDDFGTGYSSLSYLNNFPLDRIKIDRSFVKEITSHLDNAAIATAIIAMSHSLGLRVIAEGVETETQLEMLRAKSCHEVQGFLLGHPLAADDIPHFLKNFRLHSKPFPGWARLPAASPPAP